MFTTLISAAELAARAPATTAAIRCPMSAGWR